MNKKCPNCQLTNFANSKECVRCQSDLREISVVSEDRLQNSFLKSKIFRRAVICAVVCIFTLLAFYLSMIFTSSPVKPAEKEKVAAAIKILDEKGFSKEVFLLNYLTSFRSNDNWLNASTRLENAYAATNFPFEIMTIYPDFFDYPQDDLERAAILLHEAQHLKGADEKEAYEFVWRNRKQLGWTKENYASSSIWRNVRKQTKEFAPNIFVCEGTELGDCTQ